MTQNLKIPEVTIDEAKMIIKALASTQSVLLLSPPGVGKSDLVQQVSAENGLECKSLLGTQIAPEDVSGIPRIIGERSVFCPPRVLLPEKDEKFCLFLDELPACTPDIQKAFYSLLLERRVGEYKLPEGTWVVAAGNRAEDNALVKSMSAALVNRVTILRIKVDYQLWLNWAKKHGVRSEITDFIASNPEALQRAPTMKSAPFSTPRSWTTLSGAMTRLEKAGKLTDRIKTALLYGSVSCGDANMFLKQNSSSWNTATLTISEAKAVVTELAEQHSVILLSAPGVGKSEAIKQCADAANLECKSLLGTQIAPEDVSGIPRIIGERSVFCPPRVLLPEKDEKFCLFLDELPACTPDIQKAFYSLLLERRVGEYKLPKGTWVVAAGNRAEDQALVKEVSSALINRLIMLNLEVDAEEWLQWAKTNHIRQDVISYIQFCREGLQRAIPRVIAPFSTPRAWANLSRAIDLLEDGQGGKADYHLVEALAYGNLSPQDAAVFIDFWAFNLEDIDNPLEYIYHPEKINYSNDDRAVMTHYYVMQSIRNAAVSRSSTWYKSIREIPQKYFIPFFKRLTPEDCNVLLVDAVYDWKNIAGEDFIVKILQQLTGIK